MARKYGNITFPSEGLKITWEQFVKDFGGSDVFNNTPEEKREAEMRKAYEIALKDGNASRTTDKGKEADSKKD